jgi:ABC-type tungstate transport system substrate-binding protein
MPLFSGFNMLKLKYNNLLGNNVLTLPIIIGVSYKNVWGIGEWVNNWNNKINMGWFDTIFDITHEQYW